MAPRKRPRSLDSAKLTGWLLILLCLFLVGLPLLFVIAQGIAPGIGLQQNWSFHPSLLLEVFRRPLWQVSLKNSLILAAGTMVLATVLGAALALIRQTRNFNLAGLIDATAWILLVSPSFVISQGWVLFASPSGIALHSFGLDISNFVFSPAGLICIMTLTNFPLSYLAVSAALKWDSRNLWHAGSLAGASPRTVLFTLRLPLLLPAILSGALLVFVDTIGDFGLPAAVAAEFNFPTMPYSIYAAVRQSPVRFDLGGVLAFYLVIIVAAAVALNFRVIRGDTYKFLSGESSPSVKQQSRIGWVYSLLAVTVFALALIIPLGASVQVSLSDRISGGLNGDNFTLRHYQEAFESGSSIVAGIKNSVWVALVVAILSTVLGLMMAIFLTFVRFHGNWVFEIISTLSLAVPGIVLAVGYIFVWNQPVLSKLGLGLYGSPALLVLAGVASALPIAVRLQTGALAQIPENLLTAAAMSGAGFFRRVTTVLTPLVGPAAISAFAAVLASSVFDLAATMMLAPPSFPTLPVSILSEYEKGQYGFATAGAVISMALVISMVGLSRWFGTKVLLQRENAR